MDLEESQTQDLVVDLTEMSQCTQEPQYNRNNKQPYYVLQKFDQNQYTLIVRGDFHHGDERFAKFSRGKQYVAASVVALCLFKVNHKPASWKTADINLILINADAQCHASYKINKDKNLHSGYLLVSQLYPYIKIGRKCFYSNGIDNDVDSLRVEKNVLTLNNLVTSLNRFFKENENHCGVFTYQIYAFAIMRNSHSYFLFNSHATSYAGEPMNPFDPESAACLMQMFTITCLANHLIVSCNQGQKILDDSEFDTPIFFEITNLSIQRVVFGNQISLRKKICRDLATAERKSRLFEDDCAKQNSGRVKKGRGKKSEEMHIKQRRRENGIKEINEKHQNKEMQSLCMVSGHINIFKFHIHGRTIGMIA